MAALLAAVSDTDSVRTYRIMKDLAGVARIGGKGVTAVELELAKMLLNDEVSERRVRSRSVGLQIPRDVFGAAHMAAAGGALWALLETCNDTLIAKEMAVCALPRFDEQLQADTA